MSFLPNEIIIVSPVPPRLDNKVRNLRHVKGKHSFSASQNRNLGAKHARCRYLTFFDADDVPHPQRFQAIVSIFMSELSPDAILFPFETPSGLPHVFKFIQTSLYKQDPECKTIKGSSCWPPYSSRELYDACYHEHWNGSEASPHILCCKNGYNDMFANGWLSIRKNIFMKLLYNESLTIAEDGELNARIIHAGHKLFGWDVPLGLYNIGHEPVSYEQ